MKKGKTIETATTTNLTPDDKDVKRRRYAPLSGISQGSNFAYCPLAR